MGLIMRALLKVQKEQLQDAFWPKRDLGTSTTQNCDIYIGGISSFLCTNSPPACFSLSLIRPADTQIRGLRSMTGEKKSRQVFYQFWNAITSMVLQGIIMIPLHLTAWYSCPENKGHKLHKCWISIQSEQLMMKSQNKIKTCFHRPHGHG